MAVLQPFAVTIRVFNPEDGSTLAEHVLPVDSPDAEHASASTLANAALFTPRVSDGAALPVAFRVLKVTARG